jgi:hypothetical protein
MSESKQAVQYSDGRDRRVTAALNIFRQLPQGNDPEHYVEKMSLVS